MTEVIVRENESFEAALRRFTRKVQQYGILSEAKRREHFEKPSVRRKRKAAARRRKSQPLIDSTSPPAKVQSGVTMSLKDQYHADLKAGPERGRRDP